MVTPEAKRPTPQYGERLDELVAAGDRSGAVRHFMRNAIGIPAPFVALMRLLPMWKGLMATAHTLPYDWAALGRHTMYGAAPNAEEWATVTVPVLVAYGAKSPAVLQQGSRALTDVLPNAKLRELARVSHNVKMNALAPVLAERLLRTDRRHGTHVAFLSLACCLICWRRLESSSGRARALRDQGVRASWR